MEKLSNAELSDLLGRIPADYSANAAASTTGDLPEPIKAALAVAKEQNYMRKGIDVLESNPDAASIRFVKDNTAFIIGRDGPYSFAINDKSTEETYQLYLTGVRNVFPRRRR